MRIRGGIGSCLILAFLAVGAASASPNEEKKTAAMAPDDKAMMEAMHKAGTPGEAHKKLEPFIGTFDTKVTMWMKPGAPPQESTGTSEAKWIMGNRYVEERFEGNFMGQPFSGLGYTGYDNVKQEYFGTWMDTMSTGMMVSTGKADVGNSMSFTGTAADPMTGKLQNYRIKSTVTDNDHHTMEMWGPGPDGKNMKMMEIVYTRRK